MPERNKVYFASDFHLGVDAALSSKERELILVEWLEMIQSDAKEVYLLGDVFDHWFEYRNVVPRGFVHFLGALAKLARQGVEIHLFTGNHDMWMKGYLVEELGLRLHKKAIEKIVFGKKFYLAHGDGLPTDRWVNQLMKRIFSNSFLQWCFARIHPNTAIGIMRYFSKRSRLAHQVYDLEFKAESEQMLRFAQDLIKREKDLDFIIMGHRHLPVDYLLDNNKTRYINPGDWIRHFSYVEYDGNELAIKFYRDEFRIYQ